MSKYLLHTAPDGRKKLYSFMSHVPSDVPKTEITEIDIPTDKDGLRAAFQEVLDMIPVSGEAESPEQPEAAPVAASEPVRQDIVLDTREAFDNAWEDMPLALQLHYAALATENAREQIRPKVE